MALTLENPQLAFPPFPDGKGAAAAGAGRLDTSFLWIFFKVDENVDLYTNIRYTYA